MKQKLIKNKCQNSLDFRIVKILTYLCNLSSSFQTPSKLSVKDSFSLKDFTMSKHIRKLKNQVKHSILNIIGTLEFTSEEKKYSKTPFPISTGERGKLSGFTIY